MHNRRETQMNIIGLTRQGGSKTKWINVGHRLAKRIQEGSKPMV